MANRNAPGAPYESRWPEKCRSSKTAGKWSPVSAAIVVTAVLLGGCTRSHWVAIISATATSPAATSLTINIDGCANVPQPRVVESDDEVHLLIDLKLDGNIKACLSGVIVDLAQPIGARKVIDDRRHAVIPITWAPTAAP